MGISRLRGGRLFAGVVSGLAVISLSCAAAASNNISRSFNGDGSLKNGSIVSLDTDRRDYVVPANVSNGSRLIGVIVAESDSAIAVDSSAEPGKVQVATSGSATTLVSTLNGDIKTGDQVGVSPFDGVGIKAAPGSRVIGLAQAAFNAGSQGASDVEVTDKEGRSSNIKVGYIPVSISVGTNAAVLSAGNLNALQEAARTLIGHTVSTTRVALSLAVAIIALLALVTLVYASIYGSIVSIGRNPLAKYAIFRTLGSVLGLALLTTVISSVIIFFLLR